MDFNYPTYQPSWHAKVRCKERVPNSEDSNVDEVIQNLILNGKILFDVPDNHETFRYIRSGDYLIPCVRIKPLTFRVLSILTWGMISKKENTNDYDSLQYRLKKYHDR